VCGGEVVGLGNFEPTENPNFKYCTNAAALTHAPLWDEAKEFIQVILSIQRLCSFD
jgi:hypothetical protein